MKWVLAGLGVSFRNDVLGWESHQDVSVHHQLWGVELLVCCCSPVLLGCASQSCFCLVLLESTPKYIFRSLLQAVVGGVTWPEVVVRLLSWSALSVLSSLCSTTYQLEHSTTCCGNVGVPVAANGSTLVEMDAKFLGSNARIGASAVRHKGLCFFIL